MPLIQVNVFEDELSQAQSSDLIHKITDIVTKVTSEKLRDVTGVIINEHSGTPKSLMIMARVDAARHLNSRSGRRGNHHTENRMRIDERVGVHDSAKMKPIARRYSMV